MKDKIEIDLEGMKSNKGNIGLNPQLAYFRINYWKERDKIFNELYDILYDNEPLSKETNKKNEQLIDFKDSFSDIENYDKNNFEVFESQEDDLSSKNDNDNVNDKYSNINLIDENNNKEAENNIEYDKNCRIDFKSNDTFIRDTKEIIYKNYLKNYVEGKKKLSKANFSLFANSSNEVYLKINNVKIFDINYLIKIRIQNYKEEWVCNGYYGCYLLYKIFKCRNPYPIYAIDKNDCKNNDNIELKTISNESEFTLAISKGINEFMEYEFTINLDDIFTNVRKLVDIDWLKTSIYKKYLNLNENKGISVDYNFLNQLFCKKNILEEYIYIFRSKNTLNTEAILDKLINIYFKKTARFLYIDLEYINNLHYRKELKEYLSFWLIRPFLDDFENYKSFLNQIINLIDFNNIAHLIKELIEFIQKTYAWENIFIIINNINNQKDHKIIDDIKKLTENEGSHHHFLLFYTIEDEYNFNKFCNLYKNNQGERLILMADSIFAENIENPKKEINDLFKGYSVDKFIDLIKIFNFNTFLSYNYEKANNDFFEIDLIKKYIKYFTLILEHNFNENKPIIKDISFKNNEIKEVFLKQYEDYFLNLAELDTNLKTILELPDGFFFEKLIILDIITNKILQNNNYNFIELKVNSLFGLDVEKIELEKFYGKNIIFTQKSKTAEIFDFGILINKNGELIMKLYQISTKKSNDDLAKLDIDIIKLHCINISKNLQKLGQIKKFSFGIITSSTCYKDKEKDYILMKNDCKRKNFELLIYNIIEKKFYVEQEVNEVNKKGPIIPLENFYYINDKYKLDLPNYNSLFKLNPKLISMKNLIPNFNECIEKYLDKGNKNLDVKIIGKITYKKDFDSCRINDNNIGLLISGNRTEINKTEYKDAITGEIKTIVYTNDIEVKIIKQREENKIYERDETNKIKEVSEIKSSLLNPHIILYKYNEKNYIGKKRKADNLFNCDPIKLKKKK